MNIETVLTILGSNVITSIASFFAGKRKTKAETDNLILLNLEKSILLYSQIINDLRSEIELLNIKVQELETKIDELHLENKKLKSLVK
jgi:transcription initiation factor IIF auxiliary subunit